MLSEELHTLVTSSTGALGLLSAILALLIALWSASRGMSGLITALNIAYEEPEKRGFFRLNLIAVGLTIGLTIAGIIVVALVAVLPAAVQFLPLGELGKWLLLILEWPLLIGFVTVGLAVIYRYAPSRDEPQWKWVSPGAGAAVALWIIASIGFTVYVAHFNSYSKTYGSLGGVIILLTWLYISSFVILFGAAINAQSEKQTRKDSTAGHPEAMGRRGARAADTLGETR
jgi:membrane protein